VLAFISLFIAAAESIPYIATSNERSAEEGNTTYLGYPINHQYSKTLDFENDFRAYSAAHLHSSVDFFSYLRPLSELQIGKLFSTMLQYFPIFRSCNRNQKEDSWCGVCPKCISVALALGPWVGMSMIEKIMGTNPLSRPENKVLIADMCNSEMVKPFECVMEAREAMVSRMCIEKGATPEVLSFLNEWGNDVNIPKKFLEILVQAYANNS
jgi:hypothetical protein